MRKKLAFAAIFLIATLVLYACGSESSRLVGTWAGATGIGSQTVWRYEFNRNGTGAWGDGRNATPDPVWDANLGRYVTTWTYLMMPTTWSISDDVLEITLTDTNQINIYHFEFLDNETMVLTREGWSTGFQLLRID